MRRYFGLATCFTSRAGFVHEAETSEQLSLHLTVGVHCYRWVDLLTEALALAARKNVSMREALPSILNADCNGESAQARFRQLLRDLADEASYTEALDRITGRFLSSLQPIADGHLSRLVDLDNISMDTVVRHRPGMSCRVFREGDRVLIQFPGGKVEGPSAFDEAFRFIARTIQFTPRQIPAAIPPNHPAHLGVMLPFVGSRITSPEVAQLSEKSRLAIVRRLVEGGLLAFASNLPVAKPDGDAVGL